MDVRKICFPPVLKSLKLNYGAMKWYTKHDKSLLVVAFRDKKAKNNCVVVTGNGNVATKPSCRGEGPLTSECIDSYIQKMNGCDLADEYFLRTSKFMCSRSLVSLGNPEEEWTCRINHEKDYVVSLTVSSSLKIVQRLLLLITCLRSIIILCK